MDKRAALEDKRKKWMADRENTLSKTSSSASSNNNNNNTLSRNTKEKNSTVVHSTRKSTPPSMPMSNINDDEFLNKLTQKLTTHIRDEVRKELQESNTYGGNEVRDNRDMRDVITNRMDNYLQEELHTHICKVCSQLMKSPYHTPMLLFPCGHTFCSQCVGNGDISSSHGSMRNCPYCRYDVNIYMMCINIK
jgi:hypothetical protein